MYMGKRPATAMETTVYGLMITFNSTIPASDLGAPFTEYAQALNTIPGLLNKAWLMDGPTLGGFHLFADKAAADAYLATDLAAGLRATEGFSDFEVRGFDVLTELSAVTGVGQLAALAG